MQLLAPGAGVCWSVLWRGDGVAPFVGLTGKKVLLQALLPQDPEFLGVNTISPSFSRMKP